MAAGKYAFFCCCWCEEPTWPQVLHRRSSRLCASVCSPPCPWQRCEQRETLSSPAQLGVGVCVGGALPSRRDYDVYFEEATEQPEPEAELKADSHMALEVEVE